MTKSRIRQSPPPPHSRPVGCRRRSYHGRKPQTRRRRTASGRSDLILEHEDLSFQVGTRLSLQHTATVTSSPSASHQQTGDRPQVGTCVRQDTTNTYKS
eukprot:752300-Hanusia_phi.AAC.2